MNRSQFTRHVERHQRAVRRFLMALCCGDSALADDLAQDTFIKAYLNCNELKEENKFQAWIFRIAYNTFVSNQRRFRPYEPIEEAYYVAGNDSAEESFRYQDLYDCLKKLSDKERYSLLLFYMQGYSIDEISEITETTTDAVKQRLSRGRQHLKILMERN